MAVAAVVLVLCDVSLVFTLVVGVVANSLVLLVFYRRPALRTVSNRFVMNLLVCNVCSCCVLPPLGLVDNLRERSASAMCATSEGVAAATCTASVLAVLLIAVDQFCAVVDPLRYHASINSLRSAGLMVGSWIVAVVFGALAALDTPRGLGGASLWRSCSIPSSLYRSSFATVYSLLVFVIPFSAIAWIYIRIYSAAHQNSQRARKTGSVDEYQPVSRTPSVRSTSSSLVSSLRCRLSNASVFRYREETRAARVSALVIVMALLCWLPYVALLVLRAAAPKSQTVPRWADAVGLALLCSAALVSPCLFAFRSRRIQREVRRLLGLEVPKNSQNSTRRTTPSRLLSPSLMASVTEGRDCNITKVMMTTKVDELEVKKSLLSSILERTKWGKDKGSFLNVPVTALSVDTSRSSFSSGGSTQGTTSTEE